MAVVKRLRTRPRTSVNKTEAIRRFMNSNQHFDLKRNSLYQTILIIQTFGHPGNLTCAKMNFHVTKSVPIKDNKCFQIVDYLRVL